MARVTMTHPSRPWPRKSVAGSFPWNPMSPQCFPIRSNVTSGLSSVHSLRQQHTHVRMWVRFEPILARDKCPSHKNFSVPTLFHLSPANLLVLCL
jgi:hypothetical protein